MGEKVYELPKVRCKMVRDGAIRTNEPLDNHKKLYEAIRSYIADFDVEHMVVVNLDTKLKPISFRETGVGSINECIAYMPSLFKTAILENAAAIMLAHNHPSGELEPSEEDIKMTKKAVKAGSLLDIKVLEHLIVGGEHYLAMSDAYPDVFKPRRCW